MASVVDLEALLRCLDGGKRGIDMRKKHSGVVALLAIALTSCTFLTRPMQQPVIKQRLSPTIFSEAPIGTLSLTPERRVVLANFATNRFCAEAPTEIGADLSEFFQATAEADIPAEVTAKIGAVMAAASSNTVLNRRTQGMQLFLANSYFVCQMYMNGAINEEQVLLYQAKAFNAAARALCI